MPRLNGFDCVAAMKAVLLSHIPIIMLTVVDDAQHAYGLGVDAYLTKPFEPAAIINEFGVWSLWNLRSRVSYLALKPVSPFLPF